MCVCIWNRFMMRGISFKLSGFHGSIISDFFDNLNFFLLLHHRLNQLTLNLSIHIVEKIVKVEKQIDLLVGYWKSVGGVRFCVIATLWWFWCMTSDNGIVVVPVKNMFWLKFGAHPNDLCDVMNWWMIYGMKKRTKKY